MAKRLDSDSIEGLIHAIRHEYVESHNKIIDYLQKQNKQHLERLMQEQYTLAMERLMMPTNGQLLDTLFRFFLQSKATQLTWKTHAPLQNHLLELATVVQSMIHAPSRIVNKFHQTVTDDMTEKVPTIMVIGTVFTKKGQHGDFEWHIRSGEDALFLFNDDEIRHHWKKAGAGNAVIRKYNSHACPEKPRSHGIVTGNTDGYASLTAQAKKAIDQSIQEARDIIRTHHYTTVYYSAATPNGLIGTSIFQIGNDVREYITEQIKGLAL